MSAVVVHVARRRTLLDRRSAPGQARGQLLRLCLHGRWGWAGRSAITITAMAEKRAGNSIGLVTAHHARAQLKTSFACPGVEMASESMRCVVLAALASMCGTSMLRVRLC